MITMILFICGVSYCYSMQDYNTTQRSPDFSIAMPSSPSGSQDSLYDRALSFCDANMASDISILKPYVKRILDRELQSPVGVTNQRSQTLVRILSNRDVDSEERRIIRDFLFQVAFEAVYEKEKEIREHQIHIKRKVSKRTALIITSIVSSVFSTFSALMVHYFK